LKPPYDGDYYEQDPIEKAGLFQGDIIISAPSGGFSQGKNAVIHASQKWDNGVIPYVISNEFSKIVIQSMHVLCKKLFTYLAVPVFFKVHFNG